MFVTAIDGSWLDHPFWRSRFLLERHADLALLKASGVTGIWIDPKKGLGPAPKPVPIAIARDVQAVRADAEAMLATEADAPGVANAPRSPSAEFVQAERILDDAKIAVAAFIEDAKLGRLTGLEGIEPVVAAITGSVLRNRSALMTLARLKAADEYAYVHAIAVSAMMVALALQMGMDEPGVREAGLAGLLHDIGEADAPPGLLDKPASLSAAETERLQQHPEAGPVKLEGIDALSARVLDGILHHHERMDGSGYPQQLKGESISLLGRMAAVCDVYDAITSNRPHRRAWPPAEALARMFRWDGHFDQSILRAFIRCVGIYPVGSLVRLSSDELAVVSEEAGTVLARPVVRPFFSAVTRRPIALYEIDLGDMPEDLKIVSREDPSAWGFADWETHAMKLIKPRAVRILSRIGQHTPPITLKSVGS
ncbi:phosphodiesterase [Sphingomonas deserti]|uniref:Phosphodiesterase n=2 Tax=Allosphingosinicella deserti TaxID=2116704 RepID=A0A2P7QY99_9SPHN|nr:phosphodiesterase [Sphingomonas deserti]